MESEKWQYIMGLLGLYTYIYHNDNHNIYCISHHIYLSIYISIYHHIYISIYQSIFISLYIYIYIYIILSTSVNQSILLSIYMLYIIISIFLYIYIYLYIHIYIHHIHISYFHIYQAYVEMEYIDTTSRLRVVSGQSRTAEAKRWNSPRGPVDPGSSAVRKLRCPQEKCRF